MVAWGGGEWGGGAQHTTLASIFKQQKNPSSYSIQVLNLDLSCISITGKSIAPAVTGRVKKVSGGLIFSFITYIWNIHLQSKPTGLWL